STPKITSASCSARRGSAQRFGLTPDSSRSAWMGTAGGKDSFPFDMVTPPSAAPAAGPGGSGASAGASLAVQRTGNTDVGRASPGRAGRRPGEGLVKTAAAAAGTRAGDAGPDAGPGPRPRPRPGAGRQPGAAAGGGQRHPAVLAGGA